MVFPLRARSLSPTIWMFTDKYDIVMQLIISFSHRDVLLPVSGRVDVTFAFKISIFYWLLTYDFMMVFCVVRNSKFAQRCFWNRCFMPMTFM